VRYAAPYYAFRPRFGLGFGVWSGFPVAYPWYGYASQFRYAYPYSNQNYAYPLAYPYPSPYPYAYPYPVPYPVPSESANLGRMPAGSIAASPEAVAYGGVSFEIAPEDAQVFVDGGYAGTVADFGPSSPPLTLPIGVHRIELRAPGYRPLEFNVAITPGRVIPYRGTLQRGL
jgi:hypothetical protein